MNTVNRPLSSVALVLALVSSIAGPTSATAVESASKDPPAPRASTPQLIERAETSGEIETETADLYRAYALSDRWREVPAEYRSDAPWDGTLV
ncbi:MAG: hypothetical protein M3135_07715, partial [Actinomycetota bacterium]|nr:hypothetical protein [Actinomycetota bacterium]